MLHVMSVTVLHALQALTECGVCVCVCGCVCMHMLSHSVMSDSI